VDSRVVDQAPAFSAMFQVSSGFFDPAVPALSCGV